MEALTAVTVAALTIYDMCKAYDKSMTITDICLLAKSGGKSGDFVRRQQDNGGGAPYENDMVVLRCDQLC